MSKRKEKNVFLVDIARTLGRIEELQQELLEVRKEHLESVNRNKELLDILEAREKRGVDYIG